MNAGQRPESFARPGTTTIPLGLFSSYRLIPGEQKPVAGRANERATVRTVLAVQREQEPALVSVVLSHHPWSAINLSVSW
jgi:hypothetical protein